MDWLTGLLVVGAAAVVLSWVVWESLPRRVQRRRERRDQLRAETAQADADLAAADPAGWTAASRHAVWWGVAGWCLTLMLAYGGGSGAAQDLGPGRHPLGGPDGWGWAAAAAGTWVLAVFSVVYGAIAAAQSAAHDAKATARGCMAVGLGAAWMLAAVTGLLARTDMFDELARLLN